MIVVDSSVWIDFFNGRSSSKTKILFNALGNEGIIVGDLILSEVLQGFKTETSFKKAKELLSRFDFKEMVGERIATASARNYRFLRQKGLTVRSIVDALVATFCMENDHFLLHSDRDYHHFEKYCGLKAL